MAQIPHNTGNYTIGKGILYIKPFGAADSAYEDMGNCPGAEVEPTIERLPHYSSRTGYRTKDKNPVIQTEYMLNITTDEMASKNLRYFLMGVISDDFNTIYALMGSDAEYTIKLIEDNPAGPNKKWYFHRLTIAPNGAMGLISEEYETMGLQCEGLSDISNHPESPYITVNYATTTTTSTSTTTTTTTA